MINKAKKYKNKIKELAKENDCPAILRKFNQLTKEENIHAGEAYRLLSNYIVVKDFYDKHKLSSLTSDNIRKMNIKAALLKSKFNTEESKDVMKKTLVYSDDNIMIFKPSTPDEEKIIETNITPPERNYDRDAIYLVYSIPNAMGQGSEMLDIVINKENDNTIFEAEEIKLEEEETEE